MNRVTANVMARREACGYMAPAQRTCCRHCQHAEEKVERPDSWAESTSFTCALHDFTVAKGAICNDFAAAGPRASAA